MRRGAAWGATPPSISPLPMVVPSDLPLPPLPNTTKTRSGPQRVRMSSGERPIGAAKGKQSDTEALCQTPPSPPSTFTPSWIVPGPAGRFFTV